MPRKSFAVIGLGRFGLALIDELIHQNHDVLVIDKDAERIQKIAKKATHAVTIDTTDMAALKDVGISSIDHVIVAIGNDIQASILTTLILKELGVNNLTVKVQNEYHQRVVEKLGVDDTVFPEKSAGYNLASRLATGEFVLDYYDLGDKHTFFSISLTEDHMTSSSVDPINLKNQIKNSAHVELIAIHQDQAIYTPRDEIEVQVGAELWLMSSHSEMKAFIKDWFKDVSKED